jgi:hypothetical protein
VSSFFEPPPPPEEPEAPPEQPVWSGPQHGTLAGVVALELVLAHSEAAAVCITRLGAYPTGFEFDLVTFVAPGREEELDPMMMGHRRHMARRQGAPGLPPELLRVGIEFADGSKATNVGGHHPWAGDGEPTGPVMFQGGGSSGGGQSRQAQWVWPLPPPGPMSFVCEWPAAGIELTRADIDAQLILDAATRAQVIFTGRRPSDVPGGSWTSYGALAHRPKPHTS